MEDVNLCKRLEGRKPGVVWPVGGVKMTRWDKDQMDPQKKPDAELSALLPTLRSAHPYLSGVYFHFAK